MKTLKLFWSGDRNPPEAAKCPGGPDEKPPASLTLWTVARKGRQIVCQPHVVTGPIQVAEVELPVPPELLERTIAITPDLED